jgi:hypothetical protein
MSEKAHATTISSIDNLGAATQWMINLVTKGLQGGPVALTISREVRTPDQNDKCHPMIRDIAKHMNHPILGKNEDQWRHFLVANYQGQLMVPSLDNTQVIVVPKKGTSKMTKPEMTEFIEYLYSVGADYNVPWSEPSLQAFSEYREAKS